VLVLEEVFIGLRINEKKVNYTAWSVYIHFCEGVHICMDGYYLFLCVKCYSVLLAQK
jgi:hypothetical protein